MPRLRETARIARGVLPAELASADDAAWISTASALEWFDRQGLEPDLEVLERGPASRHRAAVEAWALVHDWVRPWFSGSDRLVPDGERLRDAGVRMSPASVTLERLAAAGVKFA